MIDRKAFFDSIPSLKPMSVGSMDAFMKQAIPGEVTDDRLSAGHGDQEVLEGHYRFHSQNYENLPTVSWAFVLFVFTIPQQGEALIEAVASVRASRPQTRSEAARSSSPPREGCFPLGQRTRAGDPSPPAWYDSA